MGFIRNRFIHSVLALLLLSSASFAWDVSYEGNVMPESTELGSALWSLSNRHLSPSEMSSDGSTLHIVDSSVTMAPYCFRRTSSSATGTPVTVETRVRVASGSANGLSGYPVEVGAGSGSRGTALALWSDRIGARYSNENAMNYYPVDMTTFHTIRLAIGSGTNPSFWVWLDDQLIFTGLASGTSGEYAAHFGSCYYRPEATSDSYWDYVRYSTEYLPVPEPSALMALLCGVGVLGSGLARRWRVV